MTSKHRATSSVGSAAAYSGRASGGMGLKLLPSATQRGRAFDLKPRRRRREHNAARIRVLNAAGKRCADGGRVKCCAITSASARRGMTRDLSQRHAGDTSRHLFPIKQRLTLPRLLIGVRGAVARQYRRIQRLAFGKRRATASRQAVNVMNCRVRGWRCDASAAFRATRTLSRRRGGVRHRRASSLGV